MDSREERFQRLYETGRARLVAYALRRTPNTEDAADVVAETFAIAWRRLEAIPDGGGEVPWLYAVARKVIANGVRRTSSQQTIVRQLAQELAASRLPGDELDSERLAALSAISQLSDEDREILMLVAWEGLTSRELCVVMGCTPTAARIRLHRARSRLTEALNGRDGSAPTASQRLQEVPEL